MWKALLDNNIFPEREWPVKIDRERHYYLDFAIFCKDGYFCIEVDGQQHLKKDHVIADNDRTNHTNLQGWKTFRFYEDDLKVGKITKTIEKIRTAIKRRQGLDTEGGLFPNSVKDLSKTPQLSLFPEAHLDFLNLRKIVKERFEKG